MPQNSQHESSHESVDDWFHKSKLRITSRVVLLHPLLLLLLPAVRLLDQDFDLIDWYCFMAVLFASIVTYDSGSQSSRWDSKKALYPPSSR